MIDLIYNIIVISKDKLIYEVIKKIDNNKSNNYTYVSTKEEAIGLIKTLKYGIVIIDWRYEAECLPAIKLMIREFPNIGIIVITTNDKLQSIRKLTNFYINSIIVYPLDKEDYNLKIAELQQKVEVMEAVGLIARSEKMQKIINIIMQVAKTNVTVFINGESGTGKEVLAKAIHFLSPRRFKPFIAINCGAIPESLLESELFGYEKGAFTGATTQTKGKIELADKGTLFLDEVGEMSIQTQIKFLRVLEEREFMRVGGTKNIKVDVRVITATNADLESAIEQGTFRQDLYYRLKVFSIELPPLRERKEDIPLLVNAFIKKFCKTHQLNFPGFTADAYTEIMNYDWPGNIRELRNVIESIVILQPQKLITGHDIKAYLMQKKKSTFIDIKSQENTTLPVHINKPIDQIERELIYNAIKELKNELKEIKELIQSSNTPKKNKYYPIKSDDFYTPVIENQISIPIGTSMEEAEKEIILKTLYFFKGNKKKTAETLKIGLRTLYRKLEQYEKKGEYYE